MENQVKNLQTLNVTCTSTLESRNTHDIISDVKKSKREKQTDREMVLQDQLQNCRKLLMELGKDTLLKH